ncbi:MAG: hypothetical protein ACRYG6_05620 [Janthinobacterium lividum]
MRAHRITSTGEATPGGRLAATRLVGVQAVARAGRVAARHVGGCCIAAGLAIGMAAAPAGAAPRCAPAGTPASALRPADACASDLGSSALLVMAAGPADVAVDPAGGAPGTQGDATRPGKPGAQAAAAGTLGRAVGMLPLRHARGRGRHAPEPTPGCTGMATLDGVSAALQAGPFGRRKGLAIMQFRNVVTDNAADGRVACHSDVLLSDGSLHRAEFGLRQLRHGTRLHIEVAGEREHASPAAVGTPAPEPSAPAAPDADAPAPAPPPEEPASHLPAT